MLAAEILGLAPWEAVLAIVIVFVGSATQASIGIGLGLMAAPTLSLIDPDFIPGAIAISVVPLSVGMAAREWDHVDPAIYRAVVGRVAGVLVGAWSVAQLGQELIAVVIGVSVLLAVLASAFGLRFAPTPRNLMIAGTTAGFTGTVAGVAGPPMALTYQHSDPRKLRASLAVFNTIGSAFIIPSLWFVGVIGRRELQLGLMLVPGILAGLYVGRHTITRIPADRVRPFVLAVCSASALVLLGRQLG